MTNQKFIVIGHEKIHCAGCEARIGNALKRMAGVKTVQASRETQAVQVTFDENQTGADIIQRRLEALGYAVDRHAS